MDIQGTIHFFKMTGAGNDFIFIDNRLGAIDADRCGDFVRSVCRRRLSVGADGLVLIEEDPEADFQWRFFNSDASEAQMCGNAARCAVRFAYLTGIVRKTEMSFRTRAGMIRGEILGDGARVRMPSPHGLKLGIGLESSGWTHVVDCIDTGVPHAVLAVADAGELEAADVDGLGRVLRSDAHFNPAGSNIDFACVLDRHHLAVRTYERGVEGETLACGTGVIASVLTLAARGLADSPVGVQTRGGEILTVHYRRAAGGEFTEVFLEGGARVVYEADLWPL